MYICTREVICFIIIDRGEFDYIITVCTIINGLFWTHWYNIYVETVWVKINFDRTRNTRGHGIDASVSTVYVYVSIKNKSWCMHWKCFREDFVTFSAERTQSLTVAHHAKYQYVYSCHARIRDDKLRPLRAPKWKFTVLEVMIACNLKFGIRDHIDCEPLTFSGTAGNCEITI